MDAETPSLPLPRLLGSAAQPVHVNEQSLQKKELVVVVKNEPVELPVSQVRASQVALTQVDADDSPTPRREVWVLIAIQFLIVVAIGISIPVQPFIWTHTPSGGGDEVKGGSLNSIGFFLTSLGEFLSAGVLGTFSDRFGRKPFILLSICGHILDNFITAFAAADSDYGFVLPYGHVWMFITRTICGLCGNMFIFTKAAMGDLSTNATSTKNFSLLTAAFGFAFVVGPSLGIFLSRTELRRPMLVAGTIDLVALLCILYWMKETLHPQNRAPASFRKANPLGALQFLAKGTFLKYFGAMSFLDNFAVALVRTIFLQYVVVICNVTRSFAAMVVVIFGLAQAVSIVCILRPMVRRFGDIPPLKLGYLFLMLGFLILALLPYVRVTWLLIPAMGAYAIGSICQPVQTSIGSRCVSRTEQGKLQASCGTLDVIGNAAGALVCILVWRPSAEAGHPGAVWWVAMAVLAPVVFIAFRLQRVLPSTYPESASHAEEASLYLETSLEAANPKDADSHRVETVSL